ncbi:MAG: hypothetical protein J4F45_03465 [Pseudomonadales bacterium]|nr:hypothetical protein [Pseudomonadales bacterium]
MVRDTQRLRDFEARYRRQAYRDMTYREALAIFEALWVEAREMRDDLGVDWRVDLEVDLEVARTLNGLPPTT